MRFTTWLTALQQRFAIRAKGVRIRDQRRHPLGPLACVEQLENRHLLATVSWDGDAGDNNWQTAANWSNDSLPTADDDVVIDVPGSDVTITHAGGTTSIHSLQSNEELTLSGGTFAVATTLEIGSTLLLAGGTLQGGTLKLTNGAELVATSGNLNGVTLNGDVDLTGGILEISDGLTLNGTLRLGNDTGSTDGTVYLHNTQTLGGQGTIVFGGAGSNRLLLNGSDLTVTLGPELKVRGANGVLDVA